MIFILLFSEFKNNFLIFALLLNRNLVVLSILLKIFENTGFCVIIKNLNILINILKLKLDNMKSDFYK